VNIGGGAVRPSDMVPQHDYQCRDEYQQRARECLRSAEESRDDEERTAWRELALCWLRLSDYGQAFRCGIKAA
jgi:hypothetical protein